LPWVARKRRKPPRPPQRLNKKPLKRLRPRLRLLEVSKKPLKRLLLLLLLLPQKKNSVFSFLGNFSKGTV
jgi:hypothetical protein